MIDAFLSAGFVSFPRDEAVAHWVAHALPVAGEVIAQAHRQSATIECEGTWFVGVDALPNRVDGAVAASGPLSGAPLNFLGDYLQLIGETPPPLHRAQLSAVFPGYPRPKRGEGKAAFRYRCERDAAHVDGLLPVGPARQRKLREAHAYILGLPLTAVDEAAAPLVLWKGSHALLRSAFVKALAPHPVEAWPDIDLTALYQAARREVFERCERITLAATPGEAWVLHRHLLHGIGPWHSESPAPPEGRVVAYFRPAFNGGLGPWLHAP